MITAIKSIDIAVGLRVLSLHMHPLSALGMHHHIEAPLFKAGVVAHDFFVWQRHLVPRCHDHVSGQHPHIDIVTVPITATSRRRGY